MSTSETFDPARRRLCYDGSCIGLLDDNGRCKVCGRSSARQEEDEEDKQDDQGPALTAETSTRDPDAAFDPGRALCPDGTCIGVVGADGRCKVCGRKA